SYHKIDDAGLHVDDGKKIDILDVDSIIVCAGQEPFRELHETLVAAGCSTHLIGGADKALELDAKFAIKQGAELAARL
ncbi:MAG: NADPH-dependent 2,4-dienoyl-CoA reductase, partial [Gammaproteobacteria bacterium]|nr:NADPH-dependent 2,4-dienoyl-CoA reductase [Gammaproteobacteria bacterium]